MESLKKMIDLIIHLQNVSRSVFCKLADVRASRSFCVLLQSGPGCSKVIKAQYVTEKVSETLVANLWQVMTLSKVCLLGAIEMGHVAGSVALSEKWKAEEFP